MWLKGNECTLYHFIKHCGFRFEKCINESAKHSVITKCSEYAHNYISGASYCCNEICMLYFILFLLSDPVHHGSWHFVVGSSCSSCTLNIHFVVICCISWISNVCSDLRSWRSWILNFRFILGSWRYWIVIFCYCSGILEVLDPKFLFCRQILEILDPV